MNLDEAIQHCEEVADEKEEDAILYHNCATYKQNLYEKGLAENTEKECRACAEEHRQLAEWLKELKAYKEKETCETCGHYKAYQHGADITTMDDECGGCCSWNSKWIPNTCGDAISRRAVLDQTYLWSKDEFLRVTNPFDYLRKRINSLPSVTPRQRTGRWIK